MCGRDSIGGWQTDAADKPASHDRVKDGLKTEAIHGRPGLRSTRD